MQISFQKLDGLDSTQLLALVEPVLRAHGLDGVELVWGTKQGKQVLSLTVERQGSTSPGHGVTLDLCAEVSRDLSAALDVADVIAGKYDLEVGSPGVERRLYQAQDYARFAGHIAKLKLREAVDGQYTFRGSLQGLDSDGRVQIDTDHGTHSFELDAISEGRLVFEWGAKKPNAGPRKGGGRRKENGAARRSPSRSR